jgi:hypothetical protein
MLIFTDRHGEPYAVFKPFRLTAAGWVSSGRSPDARRTKGWPKAHKNNRTTAPAQPGRELSGQGSGYYQHRCAEEAPDRWFWRGRAIGGLVCGHGEDREHG